MRFVTWGSMMLIGIICLSPNRTLAAEGLRVSALQKNASSVIPEGGAVSRKRQGHHTQTVRKHEAASAVAANPLPSVSVEDEVSDPKSRNEKSLPENAAPLELKGVRG